MGLIPIIKSENRNTGLMDSNMHYRSTMPAAPFAFDETRTIARLMLKYDDRAEIRTIIHDGNLLKVKSLANEAKQFNYIYNRLEKFPHQLLLIIVGNDIIDAKFVNLISIIAYDDLFRDFVLEVFHEKKLSRDPITDYDIMVYFERKSMECDYMQSWNDRTLNRLRQSYSRALFEAGLLRNTQKLREINIPYISVTTVDALKRLGYREFVGATVGLL